jgi:aminoglycoside phosphotransferase (APT) family kinase protein
MVSTDVTSVPTLEQVRLLVAPAFPHRKAIGAERLAGGLCNSNLKVTFDSPHEPVVLRLYKRDPAAYGKEIGLLRLVRQTVPVPEVIDARAEAPGDIVGAGPYALIEYVNGITFQQLKETKDLQAIQQASSAIGKTLAAIGRYQFARPGVISASARVTGKADHELEVTESYIEGRDPIPRILDSYLASANLQRRTGAGLARRIHDFVWSWASRLPQLDDGPDLVQCLVHSDLDQGNILVRQVEGKWVVAAVLDWEFAFSGSPLTDVGHFLRFERSAKPLREPYFSRAFVEHGGRLPECWRQLIRVIDMTGLCETLTREELPPYALREMLGLILATLENRDPY